ncbi:hypothetical protein X986_3950 [Burkholderia pseudomallei]|uniref:hypothetical protein n=1 Tax=Burkholderia pseudomallei TaxID=28450 RepID=UPI00050F881D|nr:hypothetical protein [Burkholderia pseudomallei]KGC50908.1 hypothetical protein DO66_5809 [Burkholderia pseudomallei]KGX12884.1 hypothetical protein X984_3537 [Burkholderia pseudomallei]KGX27789.1 hypothetical protein X986_3950 [Burkholderia pseudomallei]KGX47240.1 hypothetical protein Y043_5571 [Burkholderia pseudomallei MSHR2138]KGX47506.1 hypothetical protein Y600_5881 [Burkholderia pseudomallei MSHR3709]
MKIDAKVTGESVVTERIGRITPGIRTALERKIQDLAIRLQRHVVTDKLAGQVLNVRTGRLWRSINQALVESSDRQSITAVVSTAVEYAAIHEYGGIIHRMSNPGVVRLRTDAQGRLLRNARGGAIFAKKSHKRAREVAFASAYVTDDFGSQVGVPKAYDIVMPERSFLRSALKDMRPEILAGIREAVARGVRR